MFELRAFGWRRLWSQSVLKVIARQLYAYWSSKLEMSFEWLRSVHGRMKPTRCSGERIPRAATCPPIPVPARVT